MTPPIPEPTTCRSCGKPVIFVTSGKSKQTMILDAAPVNRVIVARVRHVHLIAATDGSKNLDDLVAVVVPTFTDHHATCEHADQWKGRSRANPPEETSR